VPIGQPLSGPAIVEAATTTVVVDPGIGFERRSSGALHMDTSGGGAAGASAAATEHDRVGS
jgi:N-methylhydantoinase A